MGEVWLFFGDRKGSGRLWGVIEQDLMGKGWVVSGSFALHQLSIAIGWLWILCLFSSPLDSVPDSADAPAHEPIARQRHKALVLSAARSFHHCQSLVNFILLWPRLLPVLSILPPCSRQFFHIQHT